MTMVTLSKFSSFFFFNDTATTEIYTLSLHDALPISACASTIGAAGTTAAGAGAAMDIGVPAGLAADARADIPTVAHPRSEEHTSELQSHSDLVCRLLLEKKKKLPRRLCLAGGLGRAR